MAKFALTAVGLLYGALFAYRARAFGHIPLKARVDCYLSCRFLHFTHPPVEIYLKSVWPFLQYSPVR